MYLGFHLPRYSWACVIQTFLVCIFCLFAAWSYDSNYFLGLVGVQVGFCADRVFGVVLGYESESPAGVSSVVCAFTLLIGKEFSVSVVCWLRPRPTSNLTVLWCCSGCR